MADPPPADNGPRPVKLGLEDYLMLDNACAPDGCRKTELIDGTIFSMISEGLPHARIVSRLFHQIAVALLEFEPNLEAIAGCSIPMLPCSVPQPDIVVTSEPDGTGLLPLGSVRLIVEVADATLAFDTRRKASLYARAGIREYWVIDVNAGAIRQMWRPEDETFAETRTVPFGQAVTAATIDDFTIETSTL